MVRSLINAPDRLKFLTSYPHHTTGQEEQYHLLKIRVCVGHAGHFQQWGLSKD